jgi:tetratricopeptide (TPR) repeat protein
MSARRPTTRQWRIPPAPDFSSNGLPGLGVLEETGGELGGLLWRSLRAVHAWGATVPADRGLLFYPDARDQRMADVLAAAPEPALERPLRVLAEMLGAPVEIDAERVALACLSIAGWARDAGKPATSRDFAFAAVVACPGSPVYALATARQYRDQGLHEEAEVMYQRAVALARQVGDWDSYTRAYAGMGKLSWTRGAYPSARKFLLKALRAAERRRLQQLRALVLHELFVVEIDCNRVEQAEWYAEAAVGAYGPGHAMLPVLAFDIAVSWMYQGRFVEALPVFLRIVPKLEGDPELALMAWGDIARAAGGVGDVEMFDLAYGKVLAAPAQMSRKADALRDVAYGAVHLCRLDDAEMVAHEALSLARERDDHKTVFMVDALLEEVAGQRKNAQKHERVENAVPESNQPLSGSLCRTLEQMLDAVPA